MLEQAKIDTLRALDIPARGHFIDGGMVAGASGEQLDVLSPINGDVLTTIARGNKEDVTRAVGDARAAF